jgi:hypothetical protein
MIANDRTEIAHTVKTESSARRPMYASMEEKRLGAPPTVDGVPGVPAYFQ